MFIMTTIFDSSINSKRGLYYLFVCPVEEDMGHCACRVDGTTKVINPGIYTLFD